MFANQVDDAPSPIPLLDVGECQGCHFGTSEPAAEQDGQHGSVPPPFDGGDIGCTQKILSLPQREPVPDPHSHRLHAFHPHDPGRQLRWEQAVVGRFHGQLANG